MASRQTLKANPAKVRTTTVTQNKIALRPNKLPCACAPVMLGKGGFNQKKAAAILAGEKNRGREGSDNSAEDLFEVGHHRSLMPLKALHRAPWADLYDVSIRLGPEVIYDHIECTPIPLWIGRTQLVDYKQVLEKTSVEIIPLTPQVNQSTTELFYQGLLGQGLRSPALSWNASLTDFEEEEFLAESAYMENIKLAYCLPLETEASNKYESHDAHILQPDGSYKTRERVRIILTETPTIFTIHIAGKCVEEGSPEYEKVQEDNARYDRIVQRHLESDAYTDRCTQTFLNRERDKYTQLIGVSVVDAEQTCTRYLMLDEFNRIRELESKRKIKEAEDAIMKSLMDKVKDETGEKEGYLGSSDEDDSDKEMNRPQVTSKIDWVKLDEEDEAEDEEPPNDIDDDELQMASEDEFDVDPTLDEVYRKRDDKARKQRPKILPDITHSSGLMERILSTNRYQMRHMDIRGFEPLYKREKEHKFTSVALTKANALVESGPKLKRYWSYTSAMVKGQEITNMAVHPTNGNLIAAAYGDSSFANPPEGLVCIWNMKSINYPERIYRFHISATAMSFSKLTPYLLAIGLLDGNVVVYDIRQDTPTPVSSTLSTQEKHFGPIWDLYWLQETEMASTGTIIETLLSLSDDGCLFRWNSSKGFEPTIMLKIRRSPLKIPGRRERRAEALISQLSSSFTVCFYPDDCTQYLVGTEEGFIHKATTSYTEQYIGTYIGHTGPVYRICFSPYAKDVFISCGGDWCVKIWKEDIPSCLLSVNTGLRAVFDVAWCPTMSSVFVCTSEIHIEVWDLTVNTLEPLIQYKPPFQIGLRRVCFWEYMRALVIGDDDGGITVYALRNFPMQPFLFDEQVDQLLGALIPGYKKIQPTELDDVASDQEYEYSGFGRSLSEEIRAGTNAAPSTMTIPTALPSVMNLYAASPSRSIANF